MTSLDTVLRFLEEAYIGKNLSYAESHLSKDYICHCSAGTKNKSQALSLLKGYLKRHPVYRFYVSDAKSEDGNVSLSILFECKEKEKFLGICVGEHVAIYRHFKTFKVENGMITESWDDNPDFET